MTSLNRRVEEGQDVIDSRDVIERIKELEDEREEVLENAGDLAGFDESDEGEELVKLKKLAAEGENCSDWQHGEALIADRYFRDYAMQLAEDIGAIKDDASWPLTHIDWDAAADALKQDYTSINYGETEYWVRS